MDSDEKQGDSEGSGKKRKIDEVDHDEKENLEVKKGKKSPTGTVNSTTSLKGQETEILPATSPAEEQRCTTPAEKILNRYSSKSSEAPKRKKKEKHGLVKRYMSAVDRENGKGACSDALSLLRSSYVASDFNLSMKKETKQSEEPQRTVQNSFRVIRQVGSGTFGEVYKAFDVKNKEFVAMKKIHVHIEREGFPVTALREVRLLGALKHKNVVALREVVPATLEGMGMNTSFMVFEYMDYDLTGLLENRSVTLDLAQIKCILKQLLEGIHYVHTNNIMHRDIKAANLLLNNEGWLKIGDWGLARSWLGVPGIAAQYTTRVVTLWYRAPELLLGFKSYDPKIDIWAIGCIFAELMGKKCLLPGKDEADQLNLIFELCGTPTQEDWPVLYETYVETSRIKLVQKERSLDKKVAGFMPRDALDLFKKMLVLDPAKRVSASDALDHVFFWNDERPDNQKMLIDKIKAQIGTEKFDAGLHEFELREMFKKARQTQQHNEKTKTNDRDRDRESNSNGRGRRRSSRGRGRGRNRGRGR